MREGLIGILGGVIVTAGVLSASADHRGVSGAHQRGSENRVAAGHIIALDGAVVDGRKLIVVIDDEKQTMGSYLIDVQTGQIALRCVRNFRWDLQMDEFNGAEPSPTKIQALLRSQ